MQLARDQKSYPISGSVANRLGYCAKIVMDINVHQDATHL